jgi:hypothetical protein
MAMIGGCGLLGDDEATLSGRVASTTARRIGTAAPSQRRITHVMAVDPETASPERSLAAVGDDGSFTLGVAVGHPYVLVFVDATAVGADMVVAVLRAGTLDTVSPQIAAHLQLGEVMIDPATQTASAGISYDELLAGLGMSPAAAEFLGSIDDLSLRYANPDIDGDGVLDMQQDRRYALDIHLRANLRAGDRDVIVDDLVDQFPLATVRPVFNLTSFYALYPASYDPTDYIGMGPPGIGLQAGARFSATLADGSAPVAMSSFSGLAFGDERAWGPDYEMEHAATMELPGATGIPATLAYTLGASGTTLTFSNVITPSRRALTDDGSLVIFIRLVTGGGPTITTIDYEWKKRVGAAWVPATAEEIALTISGDGGHVSVHRAPSWRDEHGAQIPAQPSGTIAFPGPATGAADICGLAVSFDDRLGVRHFIGGAQPNPGVTCTN